ncbi:hypothetical protein FKV68_22805 (plasmid) [Sinorhizobium mexicanum]|uniref:Peptidase C14 caspase domain-containing protein n=1 Tax=Sinorhizobium mexicanum TaxID=375549 RepID=A0A859QNH0_9HYPH|nr:caspase family protein [Sinorhizobium mexicanum]QLL64280.1 hypothetical protein FKV68_22805 [Sinorhizobium mexicanum]
MPLVPLPATAPPHRQPDDHAIVVGIDHYVPGIPKLQGAVNDCNLFCRWLVDPKFGGLNPANVNLVVSTGQHPPEPLRSQIEDILVTYFDRANNNWPGGRRLYLFFAGHGLSRPPPNQRECALVMADARPNLLRGLLGDVAADSMRLTGLFKEVMLVMDCCAEVSGPAELLCYLPSYGDVTLARRPFLHIHAAAWNATTAERQLPDPFTPETVSASWQGVLTNVLLRGLTTAAAENGEITSSSLKRFIEAAVSGCRIEFDDGDPLVPTPMVFGVSQGVPVNVSLRNGATRFQVRDGVDFSVFVAARPAPAIVRLKPGLWLFDGIDATGVITGSQAVPVREGGINVVV